MERRIVTLITAFILLICLADCEEQLDISNPGGQKQIPQGFEGAGSGPYHTFALGKKWEYEGIIHESIDYPEGLGVADTSWTEKTRDISEVIRETELTGTLPVLVWEVKTSHYLNDTFNFDDYYYVHVDVDSAYFYDEIYDSVPVSVSPAKLGLGDEWIQVFQLSDTATDTIKYKVIADNVEANGYSPCLKIEVTFPNTEMFAEYEQFQYWAKNEGSVLSTIHQKMIYDLGEEGQMIITIEDTIRLLGDLGIVE